MQEHHFKSIHSTAMIQEVYSSELQSLFALRHQHRRFCGVLSLWENFILNFIEPWKQTHILWNFLRGCCDAVTLNDWSTWQFLNYDRSCSRTEVLILISLCCTVHISLEPITCSANPQVHLPLPSSPELWLSSRLPWSGPKRHEGITIPLSYDRGREDAISSHEASFGPPLFVDEFVIAYPWQHKIIMVLGNFKCTHIFCLFFD